MRVRHGGMSFELVNNGHTNLNDFFTDGFEHFTSTMLHTANVWRRNMPLKVKLIFSGSFSESCIFKDFYDCKSVCEYVHHFIHETDDLLIGEFTDMRKFYATHVAEYFDEYVSEHLQSVENSSLNEIFDLIVYVYDDG